MTSEPVADDRPGWKCETVADLRTLAQRIVEQTASCKCPGDRHHNAMHDLAHDLLDALPVADDRARVIAEAIRATLRLYVLPANVAAYHHAEDTHDTVAERCAETIATVVLTQRAAADPRIEAVRALADKWARTPSGIACADAAQHLRAALGDQP